MDTATHTSTTTPGGEDQLPLPRLLTTEDAAAILNVSVRKVRSLVARREIETIRIDRMVRIHPDALRAYIAERTEPWW